MSPPGRIYRVQGCVQVRLQSQTSSQVTGCERYTLDQFAVADLKSVLKDQQEGIQVLLLAPVFLTRIEIMC
jgi:hypothetical protein